MGGRTIARADAAGWRPGRGSQPDAGLTWRGCSRLASRDVEDATAAPAGPAGSRASRHPAAAESPGLLAGLVEEASAQITRFSASGALAATQADAVILDIRSPDARRADGIIPASVHIPRTVLEWRVALDSPWRNPYLAGPDQRLILVCDHGYSSVLAAGNLVRLGFFRAGDIVGGFEAWRAARLPVAPCPTPTGPPRGLPGTGPPD